MNIPRRTFLLGLAAVPTISAWRREPLEAYASRRRALAEAVGDGVIVLLGYDEYLGQSGYSSFRQESHFYYLTGHNEPGSALVIAPERNGEPYVETLFVPDDNDHTSKWLGPRLSVDDAGDLGADEVLPVSKLDSQVRTLLRDRKRLYGILPNGPGRDRNAAENLLARLQDIGRRKDVRDIRANVARLRVIKSASEIELIQKAVDASVEGHLAAWKLVRPGISEHQIAAAMVGATMSAGCERMAYPPIVGSGSNSTILHYDRNESRFNAGEVALMDVGGEYGHYAADITRTVPIGGRFTDRQREVYDLVLGAQRAAIAAVKPGADLNGHGPSDLTGIVERYFERHGEPGIGSKFNHGLGHQVGLDVHDPAPPTAELKPGMVLTIEPGLYLPDEGFGVRIEDMVVVTEDGARVMTERLPKDPDKIEASMAA